VHSGAFIRWVVTTGYLHTIMARTRLHAPTLRFTVMTTAVMTAVPKLATVACVPLLDTAATRASAANGT
jgi:hypothetical protein